ncbi:MAG: RNA-binding protein [Thermoplasmata archaeon]|nr:RNA-binding protein [Thermoplasmata archaeon]
MKEFSIKKRYRLRSKEARAVWKDIVFNWGVKVDEERELDVGDLGGDRAFIMNGKIIAVEDPMALYLTLHGVNELKPRKGWVIVDMGAIRFLANGADVMAPGIVDADLDIEEGDMVWVKDETYGKTLVVGKAIMDGPTMASGATGKAIRTMHFVGDPVWNAEL